MWNKDTTKKGIHSKLSLLTHHGLSHIITSPQSTRKYGEKKTRKSVWPENMTILPPPRDHCGFQRVRSHLGNTPNILSSFIHCPSARPLWSSPETSTAREITAWEKWGSAVVFLSLECDFPLKAFCLIALLPHPPLPPLPLSLRRTGLVTSTT